MEKRNLQSGNGGSYGSPIEISISQFANYIGLTKYPSRDEAIAKGYFSVRDFAEKMGYARQGGNSILSEGVKSKILEMIKVKEKSGKVSNYFRPVQKKQKKS